MSIMFTFNKKLGDTNSLAEYRQSADDACAVDSTKQSMVEHPSETGEVDNGGHDHHQDASMTA
jgi:hypothetical protein